MDDADVPETEESREAAHVLTFLIADIRGFTRFTEDHGDEAAAQLAARFADVAREVVVARGGTLLELRGDEALCVFSSTRDALRASLELQKRFVQETLEHPELPLTVGVGLDAGEAVAVQGGYRGGALNLAARLCSQARAGEILATREVTHLARRIDGVTYVERGSLTFKGIADPVVAVRVVPAGEDPVVQLRAFAPPVAPEPKPSRRRLAVVAGASVLGLVAVSSAIAIPLLRSEPEGAVKIGSNSIARVNADGTVGFATELGQRPGASAVGFGSLWVAEPDVGFVARLDLDDGSVVDTIRVGSSPTGVAVGDGSVWVTNADDGTVSRIDPGTNEERITFDVGSRPTGIAYGDGALWVADALGAQLLRLDPDSGVAVPIPLAGQASAVALTPEGVWVTVAPAAVWRVDPKTLNVTLRQEVGSGPKSVLAAFDSIWVASDHDNTVSRLMPATGQVDATIKVGEGPIALGSSGDLLWVANEFDDSITAIDPKSNIAAETVPVGGAAASLTSDDSGLWLAMGAATSEHLGGTLNVASALEMPSSLDPAEVVFNEQVEGQILAITNDGLLSYRKVGGADGATLVPDLAAALPELSPDGLSYRFPLRTGIRYSTGDLIQPEDYRHGLERSVALDKFTSQLFGALEGAEACFKNFKKSASCDLSASILVEDQAVTYVLSRPDPDLLFKLALPAAYPVPATTPIVDQGLTSIPATGPYRVESASGSELRLVRNEMFEEWSGAAQPDGFVDEISWRFGVDRTQAFDQLDSGDVDWMTDPAAKTVEDLQVTDPSRVVTRPLPWTFFVAFDVRDPPFDDVRVRQAVNLAIDRARIVEIAGGGATQRAACQIVPPNFPGNEPYCPYTLDPDDAVWSAPDPDRARKLLRRAGASGQPVTMYVAEVAEEILGDAEIEVMDYVVKALNKVGLEAKLEVVERVNDYFGQIFSGAVVGGFLYGWIPAYPSAGEFIASLFQCDSPFNASGFCDKRLDARMDEASRLQSTDPSAANAAWIEIEHALIDDAVWAPIINPIAGYAFSSRTGNVQAHSQWGILLSQLWVQ